MSESHDPGSDIDVDVKIYESLNGDIKMEISIDLPDQLSIHT